jgi:hypothetical protein
MLFDINIKYYNIMSSPDNTEQVSKKVGRPRSKPKVPSEKEVNDAEKMYLDLVKKEELKRKDKEESDKLEKKKREKDSKNSRSGPIRIGPKPKQVVETEHTRYESLIRQEMRYKPDFDKAVYLKNIAFDTSKLVP